MHLSELFIIAVGVSMDAFAVSICKGLSVRTLQPKHSAATALWFGGFQALMPLAGYLLGISFANFVSSVDHWIAFILLGIIGFNMIKESFSKDECEYSPDFSPKAMFPLAVATSIDALAIGVSFAFLQVNIWKAILFIGLTTGAFSALGVYIGKWFGCRYKSKAEFAGGFILVAMGLKILIEHKNQRQNIGELIVGFCLLFLGLSFMKESVPDLNETPQVLDFVKTWSNYGFGSVLIFLAFGTVLTLVLQSSSATMAITLIMLSMGWIPFDMACAMVLGENIGTTITANIAASVGNTLAKRAAMSHTIFNVFGVCWALLFFEPFLALVGSVIELFGLPNPAAEGFVVTASAAPSGTAALYGLSMLHTLFNTFNTFILIWFIKYIERAVTCIIKAPKNQEDEAFKLRYISAGPLATPELATEQAFDEIVNFAQASRKGLGYVRSAIAEKDADAFEELRAKLVGNEENSDKMEYEIAAFLNALSAGDISTATSVRVKAMYKIIGELESLGDSGEAISRILSRRNIHRKSFDDATIKKLQDMTDAVDAAYAAMLHNLEAAHNGTLTDITNAYNAEERINRLRSNLRDAEIEELENDGRYYQTSVYYMDILNALERMGDFIINISQDLERAYGVK